MNVKFTPLNLWLVHLLIVVSTSGAFAQQTITAREAREAMERRRPAQWPARQITHQVLPMAAPGVVNFQALADYELAHPKPARTGFIAQEEDKDANFKFLPLPVPAGTPTFDPDQVAAIRNHGASAPARQRNSPAPLASFLGTAGNGSLIPPDVAGAAGPTYVMETNNQQFDIYTKTGTHHSTVSIDAFFTGGVTGGFFDPHICYDNFHQKWIVVIDGNINSNNDGGLFFAVSQTSDPTGNWWTYSIDDGDANTADLLDYPQLGYNNNWIVVTANYFQGANTIENIYVMNRASMESGSLGTYHLFTDNTAFSWGPAQTFDTTTTTLWMVQDANGASGAMQIGSITGTAASPTYNAGTTMAVTSTWNENAVNAGQKGATSANRYINSDDTRVENGSVFINGKLWFTHAIWLPATGTATYSGVDWWEVIPSTLTLSQFGRIADPLANTNYYYPSLSVNSNGDALLGYCLSGTDSFYASAAYSFRSGTDPVNTMQSRYIYKYGTATYYQTLGGTRNRYGDYTGTALDPSDASFWNFSEWAASATNWGTVIAHVAAAAPITSPPVTSFSATPTLNTCGGLVQFSDLSTNSPTSWLWNFGDGSSSNQQNPSHTYTSNGTYSVSLTATNAFGSDTQTLSAYITISLPAAPTALGGSHCGIGSFSLSASTSNPVAWFDSTGSQVASSNPFVTPVLNHTTTYWVQDSIPATLDSVGPATYSSLGAGGNFTRTNAHYLIFDAVTNFTLVSVLVDASTAGTRTIQLLNSSGTVLATATPSVPAGVSRVTLNFNVPAGTGYRLSCGGTTNMYRNSAVTGGYPFTLSGVVSITGCDAGNGYYYYFYDWYVQGQSCASARTPVTATVSPGSFTLQGDSTPVSCPGGNNGAASVIASGPSPTFTYNWGAGRTGSTISGLSAGNYTVTVTDTGGCSNVATIVVTQPSSLSINPAITPASCFGGSNGGATVAAAGGTPGYQYSWAGGVTGATVSGLAAGNYTVTVNDANSCSSVFTVSVTQPTQVSISATTVPVSCSGHTDGSITASGSGGTPGYSYSWPGGVSGATASGLSAGSYTVTVTDNNGCTASSSYTISQLNPVNATISVTQPAGGVTTGSALIDSIVGGTAPYTANWSNGQSGYSMSGLAPGTYTVTITDSRGCDQTDTVVINKTTGIAAIGSGINFSLYPNPASNEVVVYLEGLSTDASISLKDILGQTLFSQNTTAQSNRINLNAFVGGVYFIEVSEEGRKADQRLIISH